MVAMNFIISTRCFICILRYANLILRLPEGITIYRRTAVIAN